MFAGEGTPERTNRRFHYLVGRPAGRAPLDRVRLGHALRRGSPAERPDIYGKVGNSGVSIATVDDAKRLYSGFDLCAPSTSVSMTINGPAPIILAFFMNAAIDQQVEKHLRATGALGAPSASDGCFPAGAARLPRARCRTASDGLGLGLLGVTGDQVVDRETYERIKAETLTNGARHGAGRHPQGGPGPEHVHLLDRVRDADDGRRPAVLRRPTASATSTASRSAATTSPRPGRTRSPSSRSRSRTGSRSSSTTSRAAWRSTTSRRT